MCKKILDNAFCAFSIHSKNSKKTPDYEHVFHQTLTLSENIYFDSLSTSQLHKNLVSAIKQVETRAKFVVKRQTLDTIQYKNYGLRKSVWN